MYSMISKTNIIEYVDFKLLSLRQIKISYYLINWY